MHKIYDLKDIEKMQNHIESTNLEMKPTSHIQHSLQRLKLQSQSILTEEQELLKELFHIHTERHLSPSGEEDRVLKQNL